jgi:hypothetical protein
MIGPQGGVSQDPLHNVQSVLSDQRFEELVPIRPREHGRRVRGQWVWFDALELVSAAEDWQRMGWQQDGPREHQAAMSRLWTCFNRMFPPATEADANAWKKLQWEQPRVTHLTHGEYSATYNVRSAGGAHRPCVFKFCFARDLKHVLVTYEGPVRFDLDVVLAARGDAPPPEETWDYSHLV